MILVIVIMLCFCYFLFFFFFISNDIVIATSRLIPLSKILRFVIMQKYNTEKNYWIFSPLASALKYIFLGNFCLHDLLIT